MEIFEQPQDQQKMYQDTLLKGFQMGKQDILEKLAVLIEQWNKGLYSDEEFKKIINDYRNEYAKRNSN